MKSVLGKEKELHWSFIEDFPPSLFLFASKHCTPVMLLHLRLSLQLKNIDSFICRMFLATAESTNEQKYMYFLLLSEKTCHLSMAFHDQDTKSLGLMLHKISLQNGSNKRFSLRKIKERRHLNFFYNDACHQIFTKWLLKFKHYVWFWRYNGPKKCTCSIISQNIPSSEIRKDNYVENSPSIFRNS